MTLFNFFIMNENNIIKSEHEASQNNMEEQLDFEQPNVANEQDEEHYYVPNYTINDLHGVVKVIMWLSIIFTGLSLVGTVFGNFGQNSDATISPVWMVIEAMIGATSICGAYQILQVQKTGYHLLVFTRIAIIILTYFEAQDLLNSPQVEMLGSYVHRYTSDILTRTFFVNIGQIIFLSLILTLRKNGRSGFDVLWKRR